MNSHWFSTSSRLLGILLGVLSSSIALADVSYTDAESMLSQHSSHQATLLPNGHVLVTGGAYPYVRRLPDGRVQNTTEVYDAVSGKWSLSDPLAVGEFGSSTIALPDGRVLALNGARYDLYGRQVYAVPAETQIYDESSGKWNATGALNKPMYGHTTTLLKDGRVLAVGLATPFTSRAEIYDPTTGKWSEATPPKGARAGHCATLLADGRVFITGGFDWYGVRDHSEIYDPSKDSWSDAGAMITPRIGANACTLPGGRVLVCGGQSDIGQPNPSVEIWDLATGQWASAKPMLVARTEHTMTLLADGRVLVAGGKLGSEALSSCEIFDSTTGDWTDAGHAERPLYKHSATLLKNGQVLLAGGRTLTYHTNDAILVNVSGPTPPPVVQPARGTYEGLVTPVAGVVASVKTIGYLSATVLPGATRNRFTASLLLDGKQFRFVGEFDETGKGLLGSDKVTSLTLTKAVQGQPILAVSLDLVADAGEGYKLLGTVTTTGPHQAAAAPLAKIDASRNYYDGRDPSTSVPNDYLGDAGRVGRFNLLFPANPLSVQPTGYQLSWYPQGTGIGTASITKSGAVNVSAVLADGTSVTFAGHLSRHQHNPQITFPLFARLYGNQGFISALVKLDSTDPASDLSVGLGSTQWARPFTGSQYYPAGWPDVITTGLMGARYEVTPGMTSIRGAYGGYLDSSDAGSRAYLWLLSSETNTYEYGSVVIFAANDRVPKLDPAAYGPNLAQISLTRQTGYFSGSQPLPSYGFSAYGPAGTVVNFRGISYQKGHASGGHGFFLSPAPKVNDFKGQSSDVRLGSYETDF